MNVKRSFAKCFSERSLGLTRPEIEQLLEDELNKPDCETDCELVSLYVELLWEIDGKKPKNEDVTPMVLPRVRLTKRSTRVLLAVAAVAVLLVTSVFVVSAKQNDSKYKLSNYSMRKYSYGYVVEVLNLDSEPSPAAETERMEFHECRNYREYPDCSFDAFYLPEAFLDGAKIKEGDFRHFHNDKRRSISFSAVKDEKEVRFHVEQYHSQELLKESISAKPLGGIGFHGIPKSAFEVILDNIPVLVLEHEGYCETFFVDGNTRYSFQLYDMNVKQVKAFIENMKKR